jgi:hypothetical protein
MGNSCAGAREKFDEQKQKGGEMFGKMSAVMKVKLNEAKL